MFGGDCHHSHKIFSHFESHQELKVLELNFSLLVFGLRLNSRTLCAFPSDTVLGND